MGASEHKVQELSSKLIAEEKEKRSVEARLKTAKAHAEEQRKKLHYIEIQRETAKKEASNLRVELKKDQEVAKAAKDSA